MTLIAAADGSALGNPGAAGWAWYIDEHRWKSGGWAHATNNQAELMAVLSLLRETAGEAQPLHVLCDSQYVINALTKWLPGWKRRGWKKSDGKPVLNRDLLEQLDDALAGRRVTFEWVKGHAGHALNETVDDLARQTAMAFQRGLAPHEGPGFRADSEPARQPLPELTAGGEGPSSRSTPTLFDFEEEESHVSGAVPQTVRDEILRADRALRASRDATARSRYLLPGSIVISHTGEYTENARESLPLNENAPDTEVPNVLHWVLLAPDTVLRVDRTEAATCSSIWQRQGTAWYRVLHQTSR